MEISNSFITKPTVGRPPVPTDGAQRAEATTAPLLEASTHTPSPELVQLMAKLRESAEIRNNVLQKVAQRLASGDYLTSEAAEGTAEAILNAAE